MGAPGVAVAPPSDFVTPRSGAAVTGVASVPVLSVGSASGPLVPSSATVAKFATSVTPAGNGDATVTANVAVPEPPTATSPTGRVHVRATHTHPAVEAPALKVEYAVPASVSTTPLAAWPPPLA